MQNRIFPQIASSPSKLFFIIVLLLLMTPLAGFAQQDEPGQIYVVQPGDTLFSIAAETMGDGFRYPDIVVVTQARHATDPSFAALPDINQIEIGDKLYIPAPDFVNLTASPTAPPFTAPQTPSPTATPDGGLSDGGLSGKIAFSFWNSAPERCTYEINIIDVPACASSDATACLASRRVFVLNNAGEPALSPDGTRLAFRGWGGIPDEVEEGRAHPYQGCSSPPVAGRWIQTATLDGTDVRQITAFWEDGHPDWSPDGQRILFDTRRESDGLSRIMFMYSDTTGEDPNGPHAEVLRIAGEHPSWAADNERFVYRGCDLTGNRCGLWLGLALPVEAWDVGRNMLGPVVEFPEAAHPDWSPVAEDSRIVYQRPTEGNWDLYMVNADGSNDHRLTTNPAVEGLPAWSPDGQWLAYLSNAGGSWGIWIMRPDGSAAQQLFQFDGGSFSPLAVEPYGSRSWLSEQLSWSR